MKKKEGIESTLNRCFKGSKEHPPRLLRIKSSAKTAEEYLNKAENNILAMEKMFETKFFDWTITSGYYAMYHAVMASLQLIGLYAGSHECALIAFNTFYVKKGKIEEEFLDYLRKARKN